MSDIELAGVVVLAVLLLMLPGDLMLLRGAPSAPVRPAPRPSFDWPCACNKTSDQCPVRTGGECDG